MSTILDQLSAVGVVPVIAVDDVPQAEMLADALVAGGLPVAEITFRTSAGAAAIKALAPRGDLLLGAGTVTTVEQVEAAVEAGAKYIVSPGTSKAVVERAQQLGVMALPGAVTATEIQAAMELGITTVKFFPAGTSGGVAAIKALHAPFANIKFVPTGGVSLENLADYLSLPYVAAVGGSWMVKPELLREGDKGKLTQLAHDAVAKAAEIRAAGA
ncbi:MAG: bifunctional 4-hydroxy-2-oxoglutarate aldolase/2-dehydro-3-deoxy-phosphogluconate aldolase [Propionibacteriaceae bacterium]|nr:bifunctional 4-hydroxy-2-oxoglutarate aldolase/2-dehydro-3-deoxy-phosphogluconate aldolase [Propionibacteriaceae bacterium]